MSSLPKSRNNIKLLPEHLIDQIKAGEVVERPASLIKELLENSLDAGATKVDIHIIENGMELIQIEDNGNGMSFDELPYAFGRHATSKIEKYDDLFNLHSFGFRGEALASISSVSRITCTSTPKEEGLEGGKVTIHGGKIISHSEFKNYGHGTSLYIKDLFFNTPVRLKFLKSQTSEKNALLKIIHAFIISNYDIEFTLKFDDKEKTIFPAISKEEMDIRISKLFFKKKDSQNELINFRSSYDNYTVNGYVSKGSTSGYSGKKQYLFANGRFFQDKSLHQAVIRQAEKIWGPGRSGHYVMMFDVPPNKIDVNIHPNKIQIKFQDSSLLYSLANTSIKQALAELPKNDQIIPTQEFQNSFDMGSLINQPAEYEKTINLNGDISSNKNYHPLTNRFFWSHDLNKNSNLIDVNKLFIAYWIENIKSSPLLENNLSPLLITEPFQVLDNSFDKNFDFFKDLGFEFERIDEKLIVLRTIPNFLNGTPYIEVLKEIIPKSESELNIDWFLSNLSDYLNKHDSFSYQFRDVQITELVNYFDSEFLIDNNILKNIDNSSLNKLMEL